MSKKRLTNWKPRIVKKFIKIQDYEFVQYAEMGFIEVTSEEVKFEFGHHSDKEGDVLVTNKIVLSHYHAKRFLKVLSSNLSEFEEEFGEIQDNLLARLSKKRRAEVEGMIKRAEKTKNK